MIENLKRVRSRNDFFKVRTFDIHQFGQEFFTLEDHPQNFQDHLSKINDVLFPLSDLLAIRLLTNLNTPYLIQSSTDFNLLEGRCELETIEYTETETSFTWLKEIITTSVEKRSFKAGESVELLAAPNRYYLLKPETKCVLGQWNYQTPNASNFIGKYKFDFFQLSDQGRKLIKLSKNIYSQEGDRKEEFSKILNKISEKDLFFIHATRAYLVSKAQSADFNEYASGRFP
jgi:hypothetical protein